MLLSYVEIANLALQHLGEDDRIGDPNEDSRPARAVKRAWEPARMFVLADVNWSFATRTATLSARPPSEDWPIALGRTAYPLPPDLVNLVEIVDPDLNDDDDEFAIEAGPDGAELLAEYSGPIVIRYVFDGAAIASPERWPANFVKAFSFYLAWQISDSLAAKTSRKDRALNSYGRALGGARKANARTKPFRRNPPSDWARARHSGGGTEFTTRTHPGD